MNLEMALHMIFWNVSPQECGLEAVARFLRRHQGKPIRVNANIPFAARGGPKFRDYFHVARAQVSHRIIRCSSKGSQARILGTLFAHLTPALKT